MEGVSTLKLETIGPAVLPERAATEIGDKRKLIDMLSFKRLHWVLLTRLVLHAAVEEKPLAEPQ